MRVLLIGLGAFGTWFSRAMLELGHEVIAVERDEALVDRNSDCATRVVHGDGTDPLLLERLGARGMDAAVVSTSEDLSTTVLATIALHDLGVTDVYTKVRSPGEVRALDALNAAEAIFPDRDAGKRLAHRISSRAVLEYTPLADGVSLQEIAIPSSWLGRSLAELQPRRSGIQVVAVRDVLTGQLRLPPDPTAPLKHSDALLVAGEDGVLRKLDEQG